METRPTYKHQRGRFTVHLFQRYYPQAYGPPIAKDRVLVQFRYRGALGRNAIEKHVWCTVRELEHLAEACNAMLRDLRR